MKRLLFVMLVGCGSSSTAAPPANTGGTTPTMPDLDRLLALLEPHATLTFNAAAHARGCPADQTLGEYVAMLVKNGRTGDQPGDTHKLEGGCVDKLARPAPIDPPASAEHWFCKIDAFTSDPAGESPWHYELRLRVRRADGAPDLTTLSCPGTP